jgi:hypothetical protein
MLYRNLYKVRRAADLIGARPDWAWLKEIEADLRGRVLSGLALNLKRAE